MKLIDCAGLACPEPVLKVKEQLETGGAPDFAVVVDNAAALENVRRFASARGCAVTSRETGNGRWEVLIRGTGEPMTIAEPPPSCSVEAPVAFLFLSDRVGPNRELGAILVRSLLSTLEKAPTPPRKILFVNAGVLLACEGSPVLEELERLAAKGAELLSCGTCLDYLERKDKLRVGAITNMYDMVDVFTAGHRVVTIT